MTFGILYCSYNSPEMVEMSLFPWVKARSRHNVKIAAVSGMFKENFELGMPDTDVVTGMNLGVYEAEKQIDFTYLQNWYEEGEKIDFNNVKRVYQTEAEIRDKGLQHLLEAGVDYVILWDGDEITTADEIDRLLNYIQKDPLICWYRFYYKNLIFDDNTYVKDFCPPRVFRVNYNNAYRLNQFIYDNDVSYKGLITRDIINYQQLPSKTIPDTVLEPLHYTWNNYERSVSKIKYQEKRWNPPNGNGCSLRVNEQERKIEWNLDYFQRMGQSIPKTYKLKCI